MNLQYEYVITGRHKSAFTADVEANKQELLNKISGSRIAIIGAAGSIGSSVVKTLLRFKPAALSLIDLNENNLVELVRELRSAKNLYIPEDFKTMPIGLGSIEFNRYFKETMPFDYLFNLSAIKHVRSEKDIYCLMRMIDTNVVFLHDFLKNNAYKFKKVFSVSSDKAANPANLMGASKMIMEKVLMAASEEQPFSTARFANVAFSDGSLPHGFLERINKRQPISAPNDVKRYFISHQEAGELCVLSCIIGDNRDVYFPKFTQEKDEKTFSEIAVDFLAEIGYEAIACASEEEAKDKIEELLPLKKWPCYFFKSDTTGEKGYEEFFVANENINLLKFNSIGVVKRDKFAEQDLLKEFISFTSNAKLNSETTKNDYVQAMQKIVPNLTHQETGKNLDQKM